MDNLNFFPSPLQFLVVALLFWAAIGAGGYAMFCLLDLLVDVSITFTPPDLSL